MANRHFGKLADVWKHLVLCEVLAVDRPTRFFDTHAGHATYAMTADGERAYGVLGFLEIAEQEPALAGSAYLRLLNSQCPPGERLSHYPAGPMLAMLERRDACRFLFCDLDPESTASIRKAADDVGLAGQVDVVEADGASTVYDALNRHSMRQAVLYTDPFDHRAVGPAGLSPLDLAAKVAHGGAGVVYWYGYNRADQRGWIFDVLRAEAPTVTWWCGDLMVTAPDADLFDGDLGAATSPGTGFGLVCANVSPTALGRCADLGRGLAAAYAGRRLPDGRTGDLALDIRTIP